MTDKELIEAIQELTAEINEAKRGIKISIGVLGDVENERQKLMNELTLRMADRDKPKEVKKSRS